MCKLVPFNTSLIYQTQVPHTMFNVSYFKGALLFVCLILLVSLLIAIIFVCLILLANLLTAIILFTNINVYIVHFYNSFYILKYILNIVYCTHLV